MLHQAGKTINIIAVLASVVHAQTVWPNATAPLTTSATLAEPTGVDSSGLSLEFGNVRVPAYSPPLLDANANPDLSQATALSSLPDGSNDCSVFVGEVNVYYFPTATPTNTNCYTGTGAPAFPTEMSKPVAPSVYVVISSLSAGNAHTRLGPTYASAVLSMLPQDLSTIAGTAGPSAAAVFNFADLPCPPPDVAAADSWFYNPISNPTRPYMPRLLPPSQILNLDPAWSSCTFPANFQFFDPPSAFPPSDGGEGPGDKKREAPRPVATPPPPPIQWQRGHPRQVSG